MNTWVYDELEKGLRARIGLSLIEYGVLVHLSEAPDQRVRMRVLAEGVIVSKSRLSHRVARLEGEDYVRREHCADDRRGLWAVLTQKGSLLLDRIAPGDAARMRFLVFDKLTSEQFSQLRAIIDAFDGGAAAPCG